MGIIKLKGWFGREVDPASNNEENKLFKLLLPNNDTPMIWGFSNDKEKYIALLNSEEGGNSVVSAIVNDIAATVVELWDFVELRDSKGEVIETSAVLERLNNPNDLDTRANVIKLLMQSLLLAGDVFLYGEWNEAKKTRSDIFVISSEKVKIKSGGLSQPIEGYTLIGGKQTQENLLDSSNTLFIRLPSLDLTEVRGTSPLKAMWKDVQTLDRAKRLRKKLLDEGGVRNILCLKQLPTGVNEQEAVDEMKKLMNGKAAKMNEVFTLPIDRVPMGDSAADLALGEIIRECSETICNGYNYPTNLLYSDTTFTNLGEAKKSKYLLSIPYVQLLCEALGKFFKLPDAGQSLHLNTDHIEVLKPDYSGVMNAMKEVTTVNERREYLGYPPIDGGDVLLVGIGSAPLDDVVSQGVGETNITE